MRLAVIVALDPAVQADAIARSDARAWLRDALARLGFAVVVLDTTDDFPHDMDRALATVEPGDTVFVHVSGTLASNASLCIDAERTVSIADLAAAVGARAPTSAMVLAELTHDGGADEALVSVGHVERLRQTLADSAVGPALVAVRAAAANVAPLAFTRVVLRVAEHVAARDGKALLSDVVERLRTTPESYAAAKSYALVRGAIAFPIAVQSETLQLEPLLALAEAARERKEWEPALAGYRAALLVASRDAEARATIVTRMRGLERARIVESADRSTPAISPAMAMAMAMASASNDDRVEELFESARTLVEQRGDVHAAVVELERARAIDPARDEVLEALRRAYRALARWPELIDVTGALADSAKTAAERAARRASQARIAFDYLSNDLLALEFLEAALEDDPTHDEALDLVVEARVRRREIAMLERTLVRVVARLGALGEDDRARDAHRRLAALRQDGADTTARLLAQGDDDGALEELEAAVARTPLHAPTHARLFTLHLRQGRPDRAYLAALALEELDALDEDHRAVLEEHRPNGLRVRSRLDDDAWPLLRGPGADDVADALFRAIGRAAIAARIDERRAKKKLVSLDPSRRQSAESTATIVRTFGWAARALGVACPALYVLDEVPNDVAAVPTAEPSTALGPGVVRDLSTKVLAFVAGRHLAYYRPEHAVLVYFPSVPELTVLVLAAVQLAIPAMPIPPAVAGAVAALRIRLAHHLTADERAANEIAVGHLDARNGRIDLAAWSRGVALTATRAALFLCGDLKTAMDRVRGESHATSDVSVDDVRADLLAFCGGRALAELREKFAVISSTPPPKTGDGETGDDYADSSEWPRRVHASTA